MTWNIINVIDGRPELVGGIGRMEQELRQYLARHCASLLAVPHFLNILPGMLAPGEASADCAAVVAERLERIAGAGEQDARPQSNNCYYRLHGKGNINSIILLSLLSKISVRIQIFRVRYGIANSAPMSLRSTPTHSPP